MHTLVRYQSSSRSFRTTAARTNTTAPVHRLLIAVSKATGDLPAAEPPIIATALVGKQCAIAEKNRCHILEAGQSRSVIALVSTVLMCSIAGVLVGLEVAHGS